MLFFSRILCNFHSGPHFQPEPFSGFSCISLPKESLRESLSANRHTYAEKIIQPLNIARPMFVEGFSDQKGAIFGFGPKADEIQPLSSKFPLQVNQLLSLSTVPVHNLGE